MAVASAGPYASLHLAPDRKPRQHPTTQFFTGQILLLNCVAQTSTNLLELELNDFETPVSRTVYLNSVANS